MKDPEWRERYLHELWESCKELEVLVLVLHDPVSLLAVVEKLKEILGVFGEGDRIWGVKRSGEGVREGLEERRKCVQNIVGQE